MKTPLKTIWILALLSLTSIAQDTGIDFAKPIEKPKFVAAMLVIPHIKTKKDGPILVDAQKALAALKDPNRPEVEIPRLGAVDIIILFANPATNDKGNADVTWNMNQWKPDGTIAERETGLIGIKDSPAPAKNTWAGIHECITIEMETTDPSGTYTVTGEVIDHASGQTVHVHDHFKVLP